MDKRDIEITGDFTPEAREQIVNSLMPRVDELGFLTARAFGPRLIAFDDAVGDEVLVSAVITISTVRAGKHVSIAYTLEPHPEDPTDVLISALLNVNPVMPS